jgi:hypothetical protein
VPAPRRLAWTFAALALAGCSTRDTASGAPPAAAPARDARLRDDCGDFVPPAALIDAASALSDPQRRAALLEAMSPRDRVETLRAGLRLRDDAAARSCAARLTWKQIDRWECARCVDLLVDNVLRPGSEADFEEFRSYFGSVELTRFLRALPPTPWTVAPDEALGELHRIAMARHLPDYLELTRHADPDVVHGAWTNVSLLKTWNDDHRDEATRRSVETYGKTVVDAPEDGAPGLPPALAAWLRAAYLDPGPEVVNNNTFQVAHSILRWLWECTPGPRDAELLMALADWGRRHTNWTTVSGVAYVLLGRLSDPVTDAFLREKAMDTDEHSPEQLAIWALARRGDAAMLERLAADARDVTGFDDYALALLMDVSPGRARELLEELLFGPDEEAAYDALDFLDGFAAPGAFFEPCGYDWRRTSLEGFDRAAIDAKIPPMRLARIGISVPGCRTRALAVAAARALAPGDLVKNAKVAAFLETSAPAEFTDALRRIRAADGDDFDLASDWLVDLGDPEAAAAEAAGPAPPFGFDYARLARSGSTDVRRLIEDRVRATIESGEKDGGAVAALALMNGLPEDSTGALRLDDAPYPRAAAEAVLAGRPVDGLAAVLALSPDDEHGNVGACDDPRVRAYLVRLRERRELGHYWYATGQLAAMGDPAARTEFWGAMEDGRYRIAHFSNFYERTLGWDIAATMPFWIDELRSQCCRIVMGGGDIVGELLDLENRCFSSPWRIPYRRAKELWDSAGGRFVRSRIADHWVPAPR